MGWRYVQQVFYWLSFIAFPGLLLILWQLGYNVGWWWWVILILLILFIYSRFVEPMMIVVNEYFYSFKANDWKKNIQAKTDMRLVVISDLHLGVYKGVPFLTRVVGKIAALKPDAVLIAGDLIHDPDPDPRELNDLFGPLGLLKMPVFAITGNHDAEVPGYIPVEKVRAALKSNGVRVIDNQIVKISERGKILQIAGLSDYSEGKFDLQVLNSFSGANSIILEHNPDLSYELPEVALRALMICGHTHGGQIRLPWVYKKVIPCKYPFDSGWHRAVGRAVLVSSGLGEVLLPLRLAVPPEIILLNLELS